MLAKSDEYIQEAVTTVYQLTQEERIRMQCEAREDYRRGIGAWKRKVEKTLAEHEQLLEEKAQWVAEKQLLSDENKQLKALLAEHGISYPDSEDHT